MIKVVAPSMACQVIDWAMQAHGGSGMCDDFPWLRLRRCAHPALCGDGPDEVHRNAIAKWGWANTAAMAAMRALTPSRGPKASACDTQGKCMICTSPGVSNLVGGTGPVADGRSVLWKSPDPQQVRYLHGATG